MDTLIMDDCKGLFEEFLVKLNYLPQSFLIAPRESPALFCPQPDFSTTPAVINEDNRGIFLPRTKGVGRAAEIGGP